MERSAPSTTYPLEPEASPERLLTVRDVAQRLNVRESWVYIQTEASQIPFVRIGRYLRFRPSDIDAYLRAQQRGAHVG